MAISTRLVDWVHGRPAADVPVELAQQTHAGWSRLSGGHTGPDGWARDWPDLPDPLDRGLYRLIIDANSYFARVGVAAAFPEIVTTFTVGGPDESRTITIIMAPYGFVAFGGETI